MLWGHVEGDEDGWMKGEMAEIDMERRINIRPPVEKEGCKRRQGITQKDGIIAREKNG